MVVGAVTVFSWSATEGGLFDLYELLPGFVFALVTAVVVSMATYSRDEEIEEEFTAAAQKSRKVKASV
jgi:sodium/proline symporter